MKQTVNWHDFWSKSEKPGFHEAGVNAYLQQFLPQFKLTRGDTVFLPLCGKAIDMLWLLEQGFNVVGVELSAVAVKAFFAEAGLSYEVEQTEDFTIFHAPRITLYQGNFIHLQSQHVVDCNLVYDRAALVAIEPDNRSLYARHMLTIVPRDTPVLMVTLQYDQSLVQGPPFSVPTNEVGALYGNRYDIQLLLQQEKIEDEPRWRDRGLLSFVECALRLDKKR